MMRSLYSGVAGLKTHQTKMDVIGNNIANVNTVGFKSSAVNFADTFYQTMSAATGPNADTGASGANAKQIGLGSLVASITTNITDPGGTSTTNRALDLAINGDSFLIVKSNGSTYFTKSGALNVDEAGVLYCTTNNATVQGWLADDEGNIVRDSVKDLTVMTADKLYIPPTATEDVTLTGNIDKHDDELEVTVKDGSITTEGFRMTFSFYDKLGEEFTVQMFLQNAAAGDPPTNIPGTYNLVVSDVVDSTGQSIFLKQVAVPAGEGADAGTQLVYKPTGVSVTLGGATFSLDGDTSYNPNTGKVNQLTKTGNVAQIVFNPENGQFQQVSNDVPASAADGRPENSEYRGKAIVFDVLFDEENAPEGGFLIDDTFEHYQIDGDVESGGVEVNVNNLTQFTTGGQSNTSYNRGREIAGRGVVGEGNISGNMSGIEIDKQGMVIGTYTNGEKKILAQIAVTTFANPSGLEAVGNSMFAATLNSGLFDGVGEDITSAGGSFTPGALEMSNVDLASEFTSMITTQRGFQANSRIITTSDSMLEELVNLKR